MARVIIFGLQDFASLAHFYLEHDSDHEVVAFTVTRGLHARRAGASRASPSCRSRSWSTIIPPDEFHFFAPLSPRGMNRVREEIYRQGEGARLPLHQLRQQPGHRLPRDADRRELLHPRGQHDPALHPDRQQRGPLERQPHRPSQHHQRSCDVHVACRAERALHRRALLLPGRECDDPRRAPAGRGDAGRRWEPASAGTRSRGASTRATPRGSGTWRARMWRSEMVRWEKRGRIFVPDGSMPWMRTHADRAGRRPARRRRRCGSSSPAATTQNRSRIGWHRRRLPATRRRSSMCSHEPLLPLGERGTFDDNGMMPSCIVVDRALKYLYYIGWNPQVTVSYRLAIGLAVSEDGGRTYRRYLGRAVCWIATATSRSSTPLPASSARADRWRMWYISCTGWDEVHGPPGADLPRQVRRVG